MGRARLTRVAFVKYFACGKVYSARCERGDIGVGSMALVRDSEGYLKPAEVVGISYERWLCKDEVAHLAGEVTFALPGDSAAERAPQADQL